MKVIKRLNCVKVCDKKWIEVNDLSRGQYSVNKNIKFKTPMLRSDFRDYSDAYIVEKARVSVTSTVNVNSQHKNLVLNNNAPLRWWISKTNNTFTYSAEYLDIAMLYNLSGWRSFWTYYRGKVNDDPDENNAAGNYRIKNQKATTSKYFEYKTK